MLIPALGRQREMDLCKFKDGQGYVVKPCLKKSTSSMLTWLGSSSEQKPLTHLGALEALTYSHLQPQPQVLAKG